MPVRISPIHAFTDNLIWLIQGSGPRVAVVDPGDARAVIEHLEREGLELGAVLVTHKHADHVGGIAGLLEFQADIPIYGPAHESIAVVTNQLTGGEQLVLEAIGAAFDVMEVPGHTEGHIAYHCADEAGQALFCGDTLFSVGCGRVFSGTFGQLHDSLMRINALAGETLIYCAHEYTLDNIGFAKWVEPDNPALTTREREAHALLAAGRDTIPSTLTGERATNPFLRIHQPEVIVAVEHYAERQMRSSRDTFTTLRRWKDTEYD